MELLPLKKRRFNVASSSGGTTNVRETETHVPRELQFDAGGNECVRTVLKFMRFELKIALTTRHSLLTGPVPHFVSANTSFTATAIRSTPVNCTMRDGF